MRKKYMNIIENCGFSEEQKDKLKEALDMVWGEVRFISIVREINPDFNYCSNCFNEMVYSDGDYMTCGGICNECII